MQLCRLSDPRVPVTVPSVTHHARDRLRRPWLLPVCHVSLLVSQAVQLFKRIDAQFVVVPIKTLPTYLPGMESVIRALRIAESLTTDFIRSIAGSTELHEALAKCQI